MKKISAVWLTGILCILTIFKGIGQTLPETKAALIEPFRLAITYNKTTNLVFPYAITGVDRGSRDILAQKAIGAENVLQIKAGKMGFTETNLTVLTADGGLYAYTVDYSDAPANFSYVFKKAGITDKPVAVFAKDATTDVIRKEADLVAVKEPTLKKPYDENFDITLSVKGIYAHADVIYFQLLLKNSSSVGYDVQSLRFFIKDQKRVKRTAEQEVDLTPVYVSGNVAGIPAGSEQRIAVALPKFTIPDKKYLDVELMEKNGGRHLSVRIKNKLLVKARPIQ
ncbi:MAG: conjugative transposon protein TraN [Bacteroidetes bacterium]|nr:conjugative transposon protein TraN [Bacteroidota bacterium]